MQLRHPKTSAEFAARDQLLQATLRPKDPIIGICSEYPTVLPKPFAEYSFTQFADNGEAIAHANLWPRELVCDDQSLRIGLVGNVATAEAWRGQGLARGVMNQLAEIAARQGLAGLMLWSDLLSFYQKLGFESVGRELRHSYICGEAANSSRQRFMRVDPSTLNNDHLLRMLQLRPRTKATLTRKLSIFRQALSIPLSACYVGLDDQSEIDGWAVIGKGYDMAGVVHEWGFKSAELLPACFDQIGFDFEQAELLVLSPADLDQSLQASLSRHAQNEPTQHPLALFQPVNKTGQRETSLIQNCFIWGLDSI